MALSNLQPWRLLSRAAHKGLQAVEQCQLTRRAKNGKAFLDILAPSKIARSDCVEPWTSGHSPEGRQVA
jgi:hypothetical protein